MGDAGNDDHARRFVAILDEEMATISDFMGRIDNAALDVAVGPSHFSATPRACHAKAERASSIASATARDGHLVEALDEHQGVRGAFHAMLHGAGDGETKAIDASMDAYHDRVRDLVDDWLDGKALANARRIAALVRDGAGPAVDAIPELRDEVLEALALGRTPRFVGLMGDPRSGVSHALASLASTVEALPARVRRVRVPSPYSPQMMGVALARALDPGAPEKLDNARNDTAWNHARRFAATVSVLVVDDVDNVPDDEWTGFGAALKSVASLSEDGMVVVLGSTDGGVDEILGAPTLRPIAEVLGIGGLKDDEVIALAIKVAATHGCSLGDDILGSWRRTAALVSRAKGRRGIAGPMATVAARRAKSGGRDVIGYDDLKIAMDLSGLTRPKSRPVADDAPRYWIEE